MYSAFSCLRYVAVVGSVPFNPSVVNHLSIRCILEQLLLYPNAADPLNGEAAALYMSNKEHYAKRVKGARWPNSYLFWRLFSVLTHLHFIDVYRLRQEVRISRFHDEWLRRQRGRRGPIKVGSICFFNSATGTCVRMHNFLSLVPAVIWTYKKTSMRWLQETWNFDPSFRR